MIKAFRGHITHIYILPAVLWGCFFVGSCVNDENEVRQLFSKKTGVDEATGLDSYMSQGGKMKARLTAPRMLRYLEDTLPRVEIPNTLHVDFYDDSLKIESKLDARYARYYESQNKIFLKDSVRVYNIQGDTLHCMELWWDQTQQKFYTDKAVRIHRKDMIMIGIGLTAPQDFTSFEMYKVSNSIIRIPASQFPD